MRIYNLSPIFSPELSTESVHNWERRLRLARRSAVDRVRFESTPKIDAKVSVMPLIRPGLTRMRKTINQAIRWIIVF